MFVLYLLLSVMAGIAFSLLILGQVSLSFSKSINGFVSFNESVTISDDAGILGNPTVLAAQPGVLTTRTNNTSGSLTMTNSSHGIVTGQRVDLFWTGGSCYGATVGTVSGTTVPIATVSGGNNLPIATTAIQVGIATAVEFGVIGNNMQALAMTSSQEGYFVFNTGSADSYAVRITASTVPSWKLGDAGTNPLAGVTITTVYCSHNLTTSSDTSMRVCAVAH